MDLRSFKESLYQIESGLSKRVCTYSQGHFGTEVALLGFPVVDKYNSISEVS